jgi:hypothetical protein
VKKKEKNTLKKAIFTFLFFFNNHIIPSPDLDPAIYDYINNNPHNQKNEERNSVNFDTITPINLQEEKSEDGTAFIEEQNKTNIPCLVKKTKVLMTAIQETRRQQELLKGEEKKTMKTMKEKYTKLKNKEAKLTEEINLDTVTILEEEVKKEKRKLKKIKEHYRRIQTKIKEKVATLELSITQKKNILKKIKDYKKPTLQID